MLPKDMFKIKVLLKKKFSNAYESQNEYLFLTMPLQFVKFKPEDENPDFDPAKECYVVGSAVCEEQGKNSLSLSFFTSIHRKNQNVVNFPQEPVK